LKTTPIRGHKRGSITDVRWKASLRKRKYELEKMRRKKFRRRTQREHQRR